MTKRSLKIIGGALSGVILLTVIGLLFFYKKTPSSTYSELKKTRPNIASDFRHYNQYLAVQKSVWTAGLKENPVKTYADFVQETGRLSFDMQHALAHEFGALLFALRGEDGITVCDGAFSYGCYHGFFGKAVEIQGFNNIYSLDKSCAKTKSTSSCQHGLGHAILVYYETNDHINDALNVCAKLTNYGPYGGCLNGIFMEYNYSNLRSSPGSPRLLTDSNAYSPCDQIPQRFQESCYFFQAAWWKQANGSANTDYMKVGALCASLTEEKLRKACFLGAGNLSGALSEYKMEPALKNCTQMPTSHGKVYCRMGLRWMFLSMPKDAKIADKACEGLAGLEKKVCMNQATF